MTEGWTPAEEEPRDALLDEYAVAIQALGKGWYGLQIEMWLPLTPWVEVEDLGYFERLRTAGDFVEINLDGPWQARFTPRDPNLPPGVDPARVIDGETVQKEIEGG